MRATAISRPYWIYLENDLTSMATLGTRDIYMRPPYTTGLDEICMALTVRLVQDLLGTDKEWSKERTSLSCLKEHLDSVKVQLVTGDIDSVVYTIRDVITPTAWSKFQTTFLNFLHDDYCSAFFNNVCNPIKRMISTQVQLFTEYQILLGSVSRIRDAVTEIATKREDTGEMFSKKCFIQFYANNNGFEKLETFLEGLIISSFLKTNVATLQ